MKQADSLLLKALKAAIHNEKAMLGVLPQETQTELLRQAVRHGVLPFVLDACGKALKASRQMAFCQTAEQILKTQVFLQLYNKLREMKLHPLVLKGPVCAALYPKPELRLFSDVDLLAVSGEFDRIHDALLRLGCRTAGESVDPLEQTFYLPDSPLVLELHGAAFPENDAYGHMNTFFAHEKLRTETVFVQGEEIYTLGANETFLYLLCHSLKHFLHGGCGIRAVCDLLLFAEKHEKELDELHLRRCCEKLSALEFLTALFEIGEKYLGFEKTESLALLRVHPAPDETTLLEDDLAEMRGIIANRLLEEKGEEPTDDEIEAVIYEKLLTAENRLRGMMGLELLSDGDTLTCGVEPVKKDDSDKDTDTEDKKGESENPEKAKDAEPSEGTEENGFTGKDAGGTENPDTNVPGTEGTSTTAGETESDSEPEEKATEQPTESGSVSNTADTNEEELSE